jgi:hypothetical protein
MVMGYFTSKQMEADYNRGDKRGRADGARRWSALPASEFLSHAEWQGYQDGYRVGASH